MSDSIDLLQGFHNSCLLIYKSVQDHLDSGCVIRHSSLCHFLLPALWLIHETAVDADTLADTFCHDISVIVIDQLEFQ